MNFLKHYSTFLLTMQLKLIFGHGQFRKGFIYLLEYLPKKRPLTKHYENISRFDNVILTLTVPIF